MKKSELIEKIAAAITDVPNPKKQATLALSTFIDAVTTELRKNGRMSVSDLGTFKVKARAARTGRNPSTGDKVKIKASQNARFTAAPALKEAASKFKGLKDAAKVAKSAGPAAEAKSAAKPAAKAPASKPAAKKAAKKAPTKA